MPPPERILLGEGPARDRAVGRAAAVLSRGGTAALPTEGLYGYHARADWPDARARLAALKPRESGRGFILLLAEPSDAARWALGPPPRAIELIREHWPGALTLALPGGPDVPTDLRASDGTVALRCPGSLFLRAVLMAVGAPLISTSANAPGAPPPRRASDVPWAGVDLIVDGGTLTGMPSTLARVAGDEVQVLREGLVALEPRRC